MQQHLLRYSHEPLAMRVGLWRHGLSFRALGCLYLLLSLSRLEGWEFSIEGLTALAKSHGMKETRHSVRKAVYELEQQRFLVRQMVRRSDGTIRNAQWLVDDQPLPQELPEPARAPLFELPSAEAVAAEAKHLNTSEPGAPAGVATPVENAPGEAVENLAAVQTDAESTNVGFTDVGISDISGHDRDLQLSLVSIEQPMSEIRTEEETHKTKNQIPPLTPQRKRARKTPAPKPVKKPPVASAVTLNCYRDAWNTHKPAHWIPMGEVNADRRKAINRLERDFHNKPELALEALIQSLQQAHREIWCMRPHTKLTLDNWLTNGKVRQYQEKLLAAQASAAPVVSLLSNEIAAEVACHPELFSGSTLEDGVVQVQYSPAVQQQAQYPETGPIATMGALREEIAYLQDQLAGASAVVPWA